MWVESGSGDPLNFFWIPPKGSLCRKSSRLYGSFSCCLVLSILFINHDQTTHKSTWVLFATLVIFLVYSPKKCDWLYEKFISLPQLNGILLSLPFQMCGPSPFLEPPSLYLFIGLLRSSKDDSLSVPLLDSTSKVFFSSCIPSPKE